MARAARSGAGFRGAFAAARQALLDALAILPEAAAAARAELTVACASLDTLSGDHPGARARLLAAYAGAPADLRGDLAAALAGQAFLANDRVELRRWIARVLDQDRDVRGASAVSAHALLAMAALWEGDHAASSEALDRACAAFDACDDATLGRHGEMAGQLGLSLFAHERYVETAAAMARAIAAAQTSRHGSALPWLRVVRALSLFLLLDLDEAMREVDSAYEGARLGTADNVFQFALWIRAMVHLERGELDHAERAAAECASILERLADSQLVHTARCAIALVRCGKDPAEGVRDAIAAAGADLEALGPSRRAVILAQLVRPAIVSGNLAAAECWAAWLTEQAGTRGLSVGAARASTARSEVLLARGDARAAVEAAREAVGWSQDASSAYDALLARLAAGRALGAAGDGRAPSRSCSAPAPTRPEDMPSGAGMRPPESCGSSAPDSRPKRPGRPAERRSTPCRTVSTRSPCSSPPATRTSRSRWRCISARRRSSTTSLASTPRPASRRAWSWRGGCTPSSRRRPFAAPCAESGSGRGDPRCRRAARLRPSDHAADLTEDHTAGCVSKPRREGASARRGRAARRLPEAVRPARDDRAVGPRCGGRPRAAAPAGPALDVKESHMSTRWTWG